VGAGKCHKTFLLWHRISGFGGGFLVLKAASGAGPRTVPAGKGVWILGTKHSSKPPNIHIGHQTLLLATKVSFFRRFFEEIGKRMSGGKKNCHQTLLFATKHLPEPPNIHISHQIFATKWSFFGQL
jgi:hypothetical protein